MLKISKLYTQNLITRRPILFTSQFFHSNARPTSQSELSERIKQSVLIASDFLPNQGILSNFVHHNPLECLQHLHFKDAVKLSHEFDDHISPGERAFSVLNIDPRERTNEALVDLASVFLDHGTSKWTYRHRNKGFLYFFASLENLGFGEWRSHARSVSKRLMVEFEKGQWYTETLCLEILEENLRFFGVGEEEMVNAIRSMALDLKGWAGMFRRMETHPNEQPNDTIVTFIEFCAVKSVLLRSSCEYLAKKAGWNGNDGTYDEWMSKQAVGPPEHHEITSHTSSLSFLNQNSEKMESMEKEFEAALLKSLEKTTPVKRTNERPILQLYTCIDDREGSFRRHVEEADPRIETFGVAGFFGVPITFEPLDGRETMILAPEGQNPPAIVKEQPKDPNKVPYINKMRKIFAKVAVLWENASFSPIGSLCLSVLSPVSYLRLFMMGFYPSVKSKIKNVALGTLIPKQQSIIDIPYTTERAAQLIAGTMKDIGSCHVFAPICLIVGHGSHSMNNPFSAAYNCGACGGREGGVSARLFARMANDPAVRLELAQTHGIEIPQTTVFIGAMHNTTSESIDYFDDEKAPLEEWNHIKSIVEEALGRNALERCNRFLLAEGITNTKDALQHVRTRSIDAAEVRPELNHAGNAAIVVGRRSLTRGTFLDRRVFLSSYDPLHDDDEGSNLEHVLGPALVVGSGINLEYLFSTIDVDGHGAGTKAPLNIVGNIGVLQGTTGDLRPGLPTQMTEMHTPLRALYVIDAPIARVEAVLARRPKLKELVVNEWVRMIIKDPNTNLYFAQKNGEYVPVDFSKLDTVVQDESVTFEPHRIHALSVSKIENRIYISAQIGLVLSAVVPIALFGATSMNPLGIWIVLSGTTLAIPIMAYARRYLHGEYMFGRFSALSTFLLIGFNIVALAPNLALTILGWNLIGFSSAFLIGSYNERISVRHNATFAFALYQISDLALIVAAAFSNHPSSLVASCLLLSALLKSSQFPMTSLFARSMEGPTPVSALGYAGLSAHVGVVLLASTMPIWFGYDSIRFALGAIGFITAVDASLVSRIRADRKGALANATSATLGLIYIILALGYPTTALWLSFGHAAFRMVQVLRSPNRIQDLQRIQSALRPSTTAGPRLVPDWLFHLAWTLRRAESDFNLIYALKGLIRRFWTPTPWHLTRIQQWILTTIAVILAGAPLTPLSHYLEEFLIENLPHHPFMATGVMLVQWIVSIALFKTVLTKILSRNRFKK